MALQTEAEFNKYADEYEASLDQGLMLSGENADFFASSRVNWLKERLTKLNFVPQKIMDFGCGLGGTTPLLQNAFPAISSLGVDNSENILTRARKINGKQNCNFICFDQLEKKPDFDLIYTNGVVHHVPKEARPELFETWFTCLKPGGYLALWENNPWNPGTRWVMSRIPFDKDAIVIAYPEAARLLRDAGFEIVSIDFCFIFPRMLKSLRFIESLLVKLPLGAQYQVLCKRI